MIVGHFNFIKNSDFFEGMSVKQTPDGECEERSYTNGKLEGQATVIYADSSKEIRNYQVTLHRKGLLRFTVDAPC